ncbi:hypothetical protein TWF696_009362 [Orbilia brochopaga]|uniref:Uncharacterized protein n=1 Tax=Orbilia brochopaga TaxID=3140254 RepID=A0AAV9UF41_9PEZI
MQFNLGILQRFNPNPGLRQWARSRTFAGTSKPHSLYICGFRRKNFYKLMFLLFLVVLAVALAIGIGVSKRVKRIRAQKNGVVGANGSRQGITLPGGRIFVPTTTRTIQSVTRDGDRVYTVQYEQPEGITYQLSRGSVIPATSYLPLYTYGPATFTLGRAITTVEGGSTEIEGGITSVVSPTATVTSNGNVITLGPATTVADGTTKVSGGRTLTTFTSVPYTVTNQAPSGATLSGAVPSAETLPGASLPGGASPGPPSASVKVLIYNDPGGGVIIVPADQSSSSRRVVTLSGPSTPASSRVSTTRATSSAASDSPSSPAPSPYSNSPSPSPSPSPSAPSSGGGGDNGGGGDPGTGQIFSGQATFYDPGLGSCGITNSASDLIAAIGHALFDTKATANPNNNPFCGRQIIVRPQGGFNRRSNIEIWDRDVRTSNNTHGERIAKVITRIRPFRPRATVAAATLENRYKEENHHHATEPTL